MSEIIAIASDHAGYLLKQTLKAELLVLGYELKDFGCHSQETVDYPDYAAKVAAFIQENKDRRGLLICGTGIGMSMAANRFSDVRAALCRSALEAEFARKHNDANILCLGERISGTEMAKDILRKFLTTHFEAGRHRQRVEKMG